MTEFMLSENIIISYEEVDDFDGFPCNSEEGKEKCMKFQNMMQNFHEPKSNEDTMEEISQDEPSGSEDVYEDNDVEVEEIKYCIIKNSSKQKGNNRITDSLGFSYSYWRKTKTGTPQETQEYRCIKRHIPGKLDCRSVVKVTNSGEENQNGSKTCSFHE